VPGIVLVALQKRAPASQIGTYYGGTPLLNLGGEISDFGDTAALISSLDMVVSVDTSAAHLAAAMRKPTWITLSYAHDRFWMPNRNNSPWYPTVRLFRQVAPRRWEPVVAGIVKLLRRPPGEGLKHDVMKLCNTRS
jgi:ADP-heptose:LPS heptosyltransferase